MIYVGGYLCKSSDNDIFEQITKLNENGTEIWSVGRNTGSSIITALFLTQLYYQA